MKGKHVKWLYLVCDLQFFFIASETVNTENKQQFPLSLLLQTVENDVKMFIAQVEQVSLQIFNILMSRLWYTCTRERKWKVVFCLFLQPCQLNFSNVHLLQFLLRCSENGVQKKEKKTVRYFYGLVKTSNSSFL